MSWLRYLNHDWWQSTEIDALNRKLRQLEKKPIASPREFLRKLEQEPPGRE